MKNTLFSRTLAHRLLLGTGFCSLMACSDSDDYVVSYIPGKPYAESYLDQPNPSSSVPKLAPPLPCVSKAESYIYTSSQRSGCTSSVDGPILTKIDGEVYCQYIVTKDNNCIVGRPLTTPLGLVVAKLESNNGSWLL
jgi:hypothetical protein